MTKTKLTVLALAFLNTAVALASVECDVAAINGAIEKAKQDTGYDCQVQFPIKALIKDRLYRVILTHQGEQQKYFVKTVKEGGTCTAESSDRDNGGNI